MTIGTETLTIAQQGTSPCSYSLSPTSATVSAAAQTGTVRLTSAPGCDWTATTSDANGRRDYDRSADGQGSATIGYAVSGNTGPATRSATLTIGGQPFVITQTANQGPA